MTDRLPFNVTQGAGLLWLATSPLIWLGSALSKMDTVERYNVQLAIFTGVCVMAVVAGLGTFAFVAYRWARLVLIVLSLAVAAFWLTSAYSLFRDGDMLPAVIGFCYAGMAYVLHHTEGRPSKDAWTAA